MKYESIDDIYTAAIKVREKTRAVAASISDAEAGTLPEGEKWNVQQIFEHMAIVDGGATRIAAKLMDGARTAGKPADGSFSLSDNFTARSSQIADMKVEAPERVHPTGTVSIKESLARMDENWPAFEALKSDLKSFDGTDQKFPHPFFGDLTAAEWLVIRSGHEARHIAQVQSILDKVRS